MLLHLAMGVGVLKRQREIGRILGGGGLTSVTIDDAPSLGPYVRIEPSPIGFTPHGRLP